MDLADVVLCDSTGVSVPLMRARAAAAADSVGVTVVNARGVVHRAMAVTGVLDTLTESGPADSDAPR